MGDKFYLCESHFFANIVKNFDCSTFRIKAITAEMNLYKTFNHYPVLLGIQGTALPFNLEPKEPQAPVQLGTC